MTTAKGPADPPSSADASRVRFYEAALEVLASDGYGALKLRDLVARMGLTTGAFYHSFTSWSDFTDRLLEHWHTERTLRIRELARAETDDRRRIEGLLVAAVSLSHEAESAIRVWGGVDPAVGRLQAQVDAERLETVTEALSAVTGDADHAARLARAALYLLVGYEQVSTARDPDTLTWALGMIRDLADPGYS